MESRFKRRKLKEVTVFFPKPVLFLLMKIMDVKNGNALARTYKTAWNVWKEERLWREKLKRDFGVEPLVDERAVQAYQEEFKLKTKNQQVDLESYFFQREINDTKILQLRSALRHGLSPNDTNNGLPLLSTAAWTGSLRVTELLLAMGADVNIHDIRRNVPLHYACDCGHLTVVKRLLTEEGVRVNNQDVMGETPLHCACYSGYLKIVKLLLAVGADVNKSNDDGETPLICACRCNHSKVVSLLEQYQKRRLK